MKTWRRRILLSGFILFAAWYAVCLPDQLFHDSTSTVLLDKDGNLLGAKIAEDGQWRFSATQKVPAKFETCLIEFEDRNFHAHYGISLKGIGRAVMQNFQNKRIVSGGSTITMQLARIMRRNPPRTIPEKALEMILATRLELRYSKSEILGFYSAHAPFGNNVVGLEAASWRYFGRSADKLSWAESATLAVLPNAPGLIYPGKNHKRLLEKRNRLLKRLYEIHRLDETDYQLALSEPLPDKPLSLPQLSPHLLARLMKEGYKGKTIHSTIDINLQKKTLAVLKAHSEQLQDNRIYNGAILITSVKTGKILAYVGNTADAGQEHDGHVDCIVAPRSTGSILKPFLYERCLQDGIITPSMLIPDIPSQYGSFNPKNFSQQYDGAVPANQALSRSLNIPMVRLLNEYGPEKFHRDLKIIGLTTLSKPASHYGLSLILGGAEARLWDLNQAYTRMAQALVLDKEKPVCLVEQEKTGKRKTSKAALPMDKACIYKTFDAMVEVNRPDEDGNWRVFSSSQKIAWKTGTSFGFRDAWAIGVTPDYVVSVWIGNADGEGRPGLTGIKAAAPVLFSVFSQLPHAAHWFKTPAASMVTIDICHESGQRATEFCEKTDKVPVPATCLEAPACPYHRLVHLSKDGHYRVDSDCENVFNMKHEKWFVLPPLVEKYYKFNHPNYKVLPDFKPECLSRVSDRAMVLLYPKPNSEVYVPVEIDGNIGRVVFEATHRNIQTRVFWHMDDAYLGETREIHQMALNPGIGKHRLTLVDENGITVTTKFEVTGK
ncbi:MAG: penicillin-binding protein 1C [Bacteroidetes bacterium]|nr:penicillin-binding protein 1C [Bacteroidota bacterium]